LTGTPTDVLAACPSLSIDGVAMMQDRKIAALRVPVSQCLPHKHRLF
jgi:hypothetical protein